mgnify:CR=1 FL=1
MVETTYQPAKTVEFVDFEESEEELDLEPFDDFDLDEDETLYNVSELGEVSSNEDWEPDFELVEEMPRDDGSELSEASSYEDWLPDFELLDETQYDDSESGEETSEFAIVDFENQSIPIYRIDKQRHALILICLISLIITYGILICWFPEYVPIMKWTSLAIFIAVIIHYVVLFLDFIQFFLQCLINQQNFAFKFD